MEQLTKIVRSQLRNDLFCFLEPMSCFSSWPPHDSLWKQQTEGASSTTEWFLNQWRRKKEKCEYNEQYMYREALQPHDGNWKDMQVICTGFL